MSKIDVFQVGNQIALPELCALCLESLCDQTRIIAFTYPDELRDPQSTDADWQSKSVSIRKLNEVLIGDTLENVNCYAIYTKAEYENWKWRYIGQTECRRAKSNIVSQLVPNEDFADSIFAMCKDAVRNGCEIGLRLIKVEPDTLRLFIQEKAIADFLAGDVLDWNQKHSP